MFRRNEKITIISELSHQHGGDIKRLESMILQSKLAGADLAKIQLMSSENLFGDSRKSYAEFSKDEFKYLLDFSNSNGIELFASVFDEERLEWCLDLDLDYIKIATKMFQESSLCEKAIKSGKTVFISNGYNKYDFRYKGDNVIYFYCVPEYPTQLENVTYPPSFNSEKYEGYSDHSLGLTAAITAVVKGAKYIEKHFTFSHALQCGSERGHLGGITMEEMLFLRRFCDEFCEIDTESSS